MIVGHKTSAMKRSGVTWRDAAAASTGGHRQQGFQPGEARLQVGNSGLLLLRHLGQHHQGVGHGHAVAADGDRRGCSQLAIGVNDHGQASAHRRATNPSDEGLVLAIRPVKRQADTDRVRVGGQAIHVRTDP
jgi:hypothetical protein